MSLNYTILVFLEALVNSYFQSSMKNKIRLAFVGLDKFPIPAIRGGAMEAGATRMLDMNEKFQQMDFTVYTVKDEGLETIQSNYKNTTIIQVCPNKFERLLNFIYRIFRKLSRNYLPIRTAYMTKVNAYLEKNKHDIVIFCTSNIEVAQVSNKIGSKIIHRVVADYLRPNSYGLDILKNKVTKFYTYPYIKGRMMEMLNLPESQFWAGDNGIDITIPDESIRIGIRKEIRQKHDISEDEVVALYVGRLSEEKGPLELVKAMSEVHNCKLIIVGGANFSSNKMTDYVKQLYEESNHCDGRIIFTGYLPVEEARNYMYAADFGVIPSICNEASSSALLEYRVNMLPTVASDVGGMKANAGNNVLWVNYDDDFIKSLTLAINSITQDSALRDALKVEARKGLENRTREHSYQRLFRWCEELVNE